MSSTFIQKFKDVLNTHSSLELSKVIEYINPDEDAFSAMVIASCNACEKMGIEALLGRWVATHKKEEVQPMRGLASIYRMFGFDEVLPWLQARVDIQSIDSSGRSLLSYIIADNKIDYLEKLLPYWNTPRVQGVSSGKRILYSSGLYWAQSEEMVNWLVGHHANPNEPSLDADNKVGHAHPLQNALFMNNVHRVLWLLKVGADPQIATPWIFKCLEGTDSIRLQQLTPTSNAMRYLTQYGYDWSVPSKDGSQSPFELLQVSWIKQDVKDLAKISYEKKRLEDNLDVGKPKVYKHL